MKTDFEVLKPHIFDICSNLGIFASIWAFVSTFFEVLFSLLIRMIEMTEQSTEISAALNEGIHVITTKVSNYFVILCYLVLMIWNRAETPDKTRLSQETGCAA